MRRWTAGLGAVAVALGLLSPVGAQAACNAPVAAAPIRLIAAGGGPPPSDAGVALTYVGHATFLLESPRGVRIATDYNDYVRPPMPLDVVTMNHAHDTHFTDHPDPRIPHVLRGWAVGGSPAHWDLTVEDVHIFNVTTNIRGGRGGTEVDGNSIFVFETAGLCIAHLGHLHHVLTPAHLQQLGHVDVVLAPVDGNLTLDLPGMIEVLDMLHPALIVPMHYFSRGGLQRFLDALGGRYEIRQSDGARVVLQRAALPDKTTVQVLQPQH